MTLAKDFKHTGGTRATRAGIRLCAAGRGRCAFFNGDPATVRLILLNATVGFEGLASATDWPSNSLYRWLSASSNPGMDNLAAISDALRRNLRVDIEVRAARRRWACSTTVLFSAAW